jgi:hypothetical protein
MLIDKQQIFAYLANIEEREAKILVDAVAVFALGVQGEWNGDEAGTQEDRAHTAGEIKDKCDELLELLNGL